jgi:RNA-binding protein
MIGEAGLTESVMKEISSSLDAHGLIKVRVFGDDREARVAMYEQICERTGSGARAAYRQAAGAVPPEEGSGQGTQTKSGKGMREVTIVKPSPSGTKKPSVTKVLLKGNERVTQGGNIKRAKPRQASTKKNALNK